jgi:hypothetical protein
MARGPDGRCSATNTIGTGSRGRPDQIVQIVQAVLADRDADVRPPSPSVRGSASSRPAGLDGGVIS